MRKRKRDYPEPCSECGSRRFKTRHKLCDYGFAKGVECRGCGQWGMVSLRTWTKDFGKRRNVTDGGSFVIGMDPAREGDEESIVMTAHEHVGKDGTRSIYELEGKEDRLDGNDP